MSLTTRPEVVIIGGGAVGCATAYYLGQEGVRTTIIERNTVAGHASGFALGGLSPLGGLGIPDPMGSLSLEAYRLHREFAEAVHEESGVDTEFQLHTAITVASSEEEAEAMKTRLPWQQAQDGFRVEWKPEADVLAIEPRLAPGFTGGVVTQHVGLLDPYRYALGLLLAAEKAGTRMRHGTVQGLAFQGDRIRSVRLGDGEEIPCDALVLAMGPWACDAASWLGTDLPVEPLKGQILRLRVGGPPLTYVSWGHSYAVSKPDDLVWVGTTEETAGFDEAPSAEGRKAIMESALQAIPYLIDAEVVRQTACLRPVTPDGLPILGPAPDKRGVYVATGAGRKGILLSTVMGRVAADLVVHGKTALDISALTPGRPMPEAGMAAQASDPFRF
jgi:glycine oxidase